MKPVEPNAVIGAQYRKTMQPNSNLRRAVYVALWLMASAITGRQAMANSSIHPVSSQLCADMRATRVMPTAPLVRCEQLRVVRFSYVDFAGRLQHDGQVMVLAAVASHVQAIFDTLLARRFPIAQARLIGHYHGDDDASMRDNNTSAYNHRLIKDGNKPSLHAYGLAIDLNPVQNPYLRRLPDGRTDIHPSAGAAHVKRLPMEKNQALRAGMAEAVVDVFADHGFYHWGGDWREPVDYQHFQVSRTLAEKLVALPLPAAKELFEQAIGRYRECHARHTGSPAQARRHCAQS